MDAGFTGFENQSVQVRTLDTFFSERGIQRIDFLRCDIEGAEILMSLLQNRRTGGISALI